MKFFRFASAINTIPIAFCLPLLFFSPTVRAQDTPAFKIDENVTRFAFSGDARIAFAMRHVFSEKKIQLQRDDIWIAERDGKRRRILQGDKLVRGTMRELNVLFTVPAPVRRAWSNLPKLDPRSDLDGE